MNKKMLINVLGKILFFESLLMVIPLLVSLYYKEDIGIIKSFILVIALEGILGLALASSKLEDRSFHTREGFVLVGLAWILLSFFGALPFVLSGYIPYLADAFFELSSGFTTTGASILSDVESLPRSLLFFRSFTHLIGGMGVLVFVLAVFPNIGSSSVHVMKAEVPGPSFGKLKSRVSHTARILYIIYLAMTLVTIIFLFLGGLSLFDSSLLAFGAAGTGGFGIRNTSISIFNSLYIEIVLIVAMVVFGVNFNLYYFLLNKNFKAVFENEELRLYLKILFGSIALICLNLSLSGYGFLKALRDASFSVASLMTTTGYSTADFGLWPGFSQLVLLGLFFTGAMAGSTAGGLKISRVGVLLKSAKAQFLRAKNPQRYVSIKYEGKALDDTYLSSILNYLVIYILIFLVAIFIVSLEAPDFLTAFSTVATTLNNVGPGLGQVGPTSNFSQYSQAMKVFLSLIMITGRLEIFPILVLFAPSTYKN